MFRMNATNLLFKTKNLGLFVVNEGHLLRNSNMSLTFNEQKQRARHLSTELDTITSTFNLRRLQKNILKKMLPPQSEISLFCKLSVLQCQIYKDLNREVATLNNGRISPTCSADSLMLLTKVRKLCSHPHLLSQRSLTQNSDSNGFVNSCNVKDNQLDTQNDVSLSGKLLVLDSLLQATREQCPSAYGRKNQKRKYQKRSRKNRYEW